jgi:hypothetical protein
MIDAEMLKGLGWSDDLIRAATEVSRTIEVSTIQTVDVDAPAIPNRITASERADVGGPPVARTQLLIESK